jgi:peptide-methionine (S)-S-oxide reductase
MRPAFAAAVLMLAAACASRYGAGRGQNRGQSAAPMGETIVLTPEARVPAQEAPGLKTAIFSGGCFWGMEAVFSHVKGVTSAVSGYQGGASTANYDRVSEGDTGHAESVRVTYDPAVIRYDQLLRSSSRWGPTRRSSTGRGPIAVRNIAARWSPEPRAGQGGARLSGATGHAHLWKRAVVTRMEPMKGFYPAETDHQDFMLKIRITLYPYWDVPKVAGLKQVFPQVYKADFTRN